MTRVLFVCLGNICRSPLAEGVFRHLVEERGLTSRFEIDSAGTGAWHVGDPPDHRSQAVARQNGIHMDGRARQVRAEDLREFDLVVAMDHSNQRSLEHLAGRTGGDATIRLLREFDAHADGDEVPDPYYGGPGGFESVFDLVYRSCDALLDHLLNGPPSADDPLHADDPPHADEAV